MKKAIITFGRYNPPSTGHAKLFDTASALSKKYQADLKIFASHTQDKKKNPLSYNDKIKFLKLSFPKYKSSIIVTDSRTIFDILEELSEQGYTDIIFVVGDDRVKEFRDLVKLDKFNADHENKINSYKVASAGERDPDSEDSTEAMSASKLRDFAVKKDLKNFSAGVPSALSKENVIKLFNAVRNGLKINKTEDHMKIKEETKPGFDPAGNPSRLWQSFRKWFYLQDEEFVDTDDEGKQKKEESKSKKKINEKLNK